MRLACFGSRFDFLLFVPTFVALRPFFLMNSRLGAYLFGFFFNEIFNIIETRKYKMAPIVQPAEKYVRLDMAEK